MSEHDFWAKTTVQFDTVYFLMIKLYFNKNSNMGLLKHYILMSYVFCFTATS